MVLPFVTRRNYLVVGFVSGGGGSICTVISMWNYNSSVYTLNLGSTVAITRDGTDIIITPAGTDYELNAILI